MRDASTATLHTWLAEPMPPDVAAAIERLRRAPGARHVAVMPDVHLAQDVCVGTVVGCEGTLYPQAVGGDIGCGMLAVAFDEDAGRLADPREAARVLQSIQQAVPAQRQHRRSCRGLPDELAAERLSNGRLVATAKRQASLQLGTLGGGNHFVELQADEEDRLWLMVHSGSRGMGQAIRTHHMERASPAAAGLRVLEATSPAGAAYLNDVEWARRYAEANRSAIARAVEEAVFCPARWATAISADHNHVALEDHGGCALWVHRKGAMMAAAGVPGVLPGSMGTHSYHVEGRGVAEALRSSAHGAGRAMSRDRARRAITSRELGRQMAGVWYDFRLAEALREEAPRAYKDVRSVLRAQAELVKVIRRLRPILNHKST